LVGATGGVYKGQGRNHYEIMTHNYYEFLVHDQITIINPRFVKTINDYQNRSKKYFGN